LSGSKIRSDQLVIRAINAHQGGRFAEAQALYEQALTRHPGDPDALHFFGVLRHNLQQSAAGIDLIQRSLEVAPNNPHAWLNLGNILMELKRAPDAKRAYERSSELAPGLADAWYNLGICLRQLAEAPAAVTALDRAVKLRPSHAPSRYQRGIAQRDAGNFPTAEADYRGALTLAPGYVEVYESLSMLLYLQSRFADAARTYRAWLDHEPESSIAKHMAAAMSGEEVPARASDAYVTSTFDRFAATFDCNLANLGYAAPQIVAAALSTAMGQDVPCANLLDVGCGTGLCGTLLRTLTRHLVGVDLSPAMIEKARARAIYDELHVGELCAFMHGQERAFDAIVAADTLNYFGALEQPLAAAARCLKKNGLLVMTLEQSSTASVVQYFRLEPHGRYSHQVAYAESALAAASFTMVAAHEQVLRRERHEDVHGMVLIARQVH
jgi:predicted TPR repeat methyltransferase